MPRYKITLEYDGTGFAGWQKQPDKPTIQQSLENAILKFSQENPETVAAGRTDAGVHARGQVVHFDLSKEYNMHNLIRGINYYMETRSIALIQAEKTTPDFNARLHAKKRYYQYHIVNHSAVLALDRHRAWHVPKKLDIGAMKSASEILIGKHDFTSFRSSECQAKNPIRTLDEIKIESEGENIFLYFSAQSFLHHMVRNIVGTLKLVGEGKWQAEDIKNALEACNRSAAGPTAPPEGLYFMKVEY